MSAREEILGRVRNAIADIDRTAEVAVPWSYGQEVGTGDLDVIARFVERVEDYRADVVRTDDDGVADAIATALGGTTRLLADDGVPASWLGGTAAERVTDAGLNPYDLDTIDAVVTTATVGIANTGTIVLTHERGQGRRATTLVPDLHVCVVRADEIVDDVPAAVARLSAAGKQTRPMTWISGPSATSDIELDRVEGVHGPRSLHVVVVG